MLPPGFQTRPDSVKVLSDVHIESIRFMELGGDKRCYCLSQLTCRLAPRRESRRDPRPNSPT